MVKQKRQKVKKMSSFQDELESSEIRKVPDNQLFSIDTKGIKSSHYINSFLSTNPLVRKKRSVDYQKQLVKRIKVDAIKKPVKEQKRVKDIWSVQEVEEIVEKEGENDFIIEFTKPVAVKKPNTPAPVIDAEAVPVPHPGSSYNPDEEMRVECIEQVAKHEMEKVEKLEKAKKKMDFDPEVHGGPDTELVVDEDEEEEQESQQEDSKEIVKENDNDENEQVGKRKTKRERNKELRKKEQERQQERLRQEKLLHASVDKVLQELKQNPTLAEPLPVAKPISEKKFEKETERLLKRVKKPMDAVVFEKETLRRIQPDSNLFKDRFVSLQQRALIEARDPKGKRKSRFKEKITESHSYKRFV